MIINWKKAECSIKPKEVDYESSPTSVTLNRKIKEELREGVVWYTYETAIIPKEDYVIYAAEQAREDNLAIMSALVDIYAQLGG